jgi:YD repeat-containing protein
VAFDYLYCFALLHIKGNILSSTDANGKVSKYEYDLCNNFIKTVDPLGRIETKEYDENGNVKRVTDSIAKNSIER